MLTLATVTRRALSRKLAGGVEQIGKTPWLFNDLERDQLIEALAATCGTAELLGRARIRERQIQAIARRHYAAFQFADGTAGELRPLAPEAAVNYFKGLVPTLGTDPQRFGEDMRRRAFTLAAATEKTLLEKVQAHITDVLTTGSDPSGLTVDSILVAAGVSPKNPQYADAVFRTNMMDSFVTGYDEERRHPDVIETFPVWRYDGIEDHRQRPRHRELSGNYYDANVPFVAVRGTEPEDAINCRCVPTAIDRFTWEKLQAGGADISDP